MAAHVAEFRRDREENSFGAWLRTITRNKVRDHFRRGRNQPAAKGGTNAYKQMLDLSALQEELVALDQRPRQRPAVPAPGTGGGASRVREQHLGSLLSGGGGEPISHGRRPGQWDSSVHAVYMAKSRVLKRLRQEL